MSLKAETSLDVHQMIRATEAMASAVEAEVVIVNNKTIAKLTTQELVTVGTGRRPNQLATKMRNSLNA